MATSGTSTLTTSTLEIITEALEMLGVLGEGESPTTDQITSSKRTLNNLVKTFQAEGFNLFAKENLYVFLVQGQTSYDLYNGSDVRFTTSYYSTVTSAAASATDTSVDLESVSGISVSDNIGIRLDDNTMQWCTVSSIVGNTVNITPALTGDVLEGAVVHTYTTQGNRPKKALEAFYRQYSSTTFVDLPIFLEGMTYYNQFTDKSTQGAPNTVYFDPQRIKSTIYVWPAGDLDGDIIWLTVQRDLDIFSSNADEPDYPSEWFMVLATNLAKHLAPKYGIPQQDYLRIAMHAQEMYDMASGFDGEDNTSFYFRPDIQGR